MIEQRRDDPDYAFLFRRGALAPGDGVVHFEHGLAAFDGTETVEVPDGEGGAFRQRLIRLRYRNGGKLMLPEAEMAHVWRFGAPAESLSLDRLKSGDWLKRRDALIVELRQAARDLAAEYRRRRGRPAPAAEPDGRVEAFERDFPHEPTGDQARAFERVAADMAQTRPMDRVVVGDVGFGKTEVALRAVAAAAFAGRQAVVAAPTTVLARQHARTFAERLEPHGVRVVELRGDSDDAVVAALEDGTAQVVVGTHALVSRGPRFKDLALVVIDEEQRFGTDTKRGLRALGGERGVHVLATTATPIPRTLAAAEVGLVDVSVVAEAPKDRLPVETTVLERDREEGAQAMIEALERELARDGQAYVVCPRIAGIEGDEEGETVGVLDMLDGLGVPVAVAHGRMDGDAVERAMLDFTEGRARVLVATSIIESGIDNPHANTMVAWNADRFGLAQLHQLRGRIGRSRLPAYMVLLTARSLEDDDAARRRLEAFAEMSTLGAGFAVARKDQEIRGFGELGGEEQSGQVSGLGIELYRHLLAEALRGELATAADDDEDDDAAAAAA